MQNILTSNYQANNRLKSGGRKMSHISGNVLNVSEIMLIKHLAD